jgi:hypothetical protein
MARRQPPELFAATSWSRGPFLIGSDPLSFIESGFSGSFLFSWPVHQFPSERSIVPVSIPMVFGAITASLRTACADTLPQAPEPESRPGEFESKDGETDRNYNHRRSRGNNHDNAKQQNCGADDGDGESTSEFYGNVEYVHLPARVHLRHLKEYHGSYS